MKYLKAGLVLTTAVIGMIPPVVSAQTNNRVFQYKSPPIEAIQPQVTYSEAAPNPFDTYAGFSLTGLQNIGDNTVNNIKVIFTAKVSDGVEKLTLYKPGQYLPAGCTWLKDTNTGMPVPGNPVVFTCFVGQLKSGQTFDPFTVFYRVPTKNEGNGFDGPESDKITTTWRLEYAEGTPTPDNSIEETTLTLVTLGTTNPKEIITSLPKTGAKQIVYTGIKGYPSKNENAEDVKAFTEQLEVPNLPGNLTYAKATINVGKNKDAQCVNLANFAECPEFKTRVETPDNVTVTFSDSNPLIFVYRIDSSNLLKSNQQILNNVQFTYTGGCVDNNNPTSDTCNYFEEPVTGCPTNTSKPNLPCLVDKGARCYPKNYSVPDLRGDCEWTLQNTKNYLTRAR